MILFGKVCVCKIDYLLSTNATNSSYSGNHGDQPPFSVVGGALSALHDLHLPVSKLRDGDSAAAPAIELQMKVNTTKVSNHGEGLAATSAFTFKTLE